MDTKTHIVVTTSVNYEPVYSFFRESLRGSHQVEVHEYIIDMSAFNGIGDFHTDGWYYACRTRIINMLDFMFSNPSVKHVIFSDADIHFLNPQKLPELVQEAESRNLDYYGMRENNSHQFNCGFIVMKNHKKCHDFLNQVVYRLDHERLPYADQSVINELLLHGNVHDMTFDFIPNDLVVWGADPQPHPNAIFHHAVCASTVSEKIEQIQYIIQLFKELYP